MVITNSYFTASAKELGESTGVRLVDRTQLQVYLDEYNQTMAQGYKASSLSQED
jgi:HJR/Mrr/RecB family endonuclease